MVDRYGVDSRVGDATVDRDDGAFQIREFFHRLNFILFRRDPDGGGLPVGEKFVEKRFGILFQTELAFSAEGAHDPLNDVAEIVVGVPFFPILADDASNPLRRSVFLQVFIPEKSSFSCPPDNHAVFEEIFQRLLNREAANSVTTA